MKNDLMLTAADFALGDDEKKRVIANLTELHDKVLDTMSPNTRKAYLSDFNQYLLFCQQHNLSSLASDWKITKVSIEQYFESMMSSELKHHSIRRKLASIRFFIGVAELPDPFKHSKLHRTYINNRLNTKPSAQSQAPALRVDEVEQISRSNTDDSLLGQRNIALLNVGIDTLFRASNIVAIELQHIDWQKATIFAPYSKTDQSGQGHYGYMSKMTMRLLKEWVDNAQITEGPVFRVLSPKKTVQSKAISTRTLWGIFKELGATLKDGKQYSCHSTRTGAVISMLESNVPLLEIIESGDWKSSAMPARYGKQFNAATTGMAKVR
ncbi:integrase [Glaciecola punicea]|uniref:tyrosine-type recombinase/integrase n=1 Tax=Glaciecola punicea TaxID=56804 RepID=UPI0008730AB6|nr:tyrosine-type recombinase/integrase [Glaciecola punicea]OFA29698.1 integrase [Glaciecola punicea]